MEKEQQGSYDFVFLSGDQSTCNNKIGAPDTAEKNQSSADANSRIVETLTSLHKEDGKLIYIPGNHDAECLMDAATSPTINATSLNLHERAIELVPGLLIAGMGGSMPTLFKADDSTEWISVFNPFPYADEVAYTEAIN